MKGRRFAAESKEGAAGGAGQQLKLFQQQPQPPVGLQGTLDFYLERSM
jgi:hypothetical protein